MKITRNSKKATGGITKEEKEKLNLISKKWIENSMSTISNHPLSKKERHKIIFENVKKLYASANLKTPNIIIVPSPFVMSITFGISSTWWYLKNKKAKLPTTRDATIDATYAATAATYAATAATYAATRDATRDATYVATYDATDAATRDATRDATDDATIDATYTATDAATRDATRAATDAATRAATDAATRDATRAATYDATRAATDAATRDAARDATDDATYDATRDATRAATRDATRDATYDATRDATDAATYDATRDATDAATRDATDAATRDATRDATDDATIDATYTATDDATIENWILKLSKSFCGEYFKLALECSKLWCRTYQGGNMWAWFLSYAQGMREVIGLSGLNCWEKYNSWENLGYVSGFRVLHKKFCLVCDLPEVYHTIKIGEVYQLHCDGGPAIKWVDGFSIWALNGIKVTKEIAETPAENLDPKIALTEKNTDVQREVIRKIGYDRMLKACNAKIIEEWTCPKTNLKYTMRHMKIGEIDRRYLCYEHASMKGIFYAKCVPPEAKNIVQMRGFQVGSATREELASGKYTDKEILKMLPETVQ